ncbi:PREDICTED: basic proline-rich protein-like, partial [Dipodomys ordii]|uniref:Basic proline-rich protein-like n=1 Tax=Dipodomys ordii TaxID=10020 RepID=A0A1S3GWS5_DIPOR
PEEAGGPEIAPALDGPQQPGPPPEPGRPPRGPAAPPRAGAATARPPRAGPGARTESLAPGLRLPGPGPALPAAAPTRPTPVSLPDRPARGCGRDPWTRAPGRPRSHRSGLTRQPGPAAHSPTARRSPSRAEARGGGGSGRRECAAPGYGDTPRHAPPRPRVTGPAPTDGPAHCVSPAHGRPAPGGSGLALRLAGRSRRGGASAWGRPQLSEPPSPKPEAGPGVGPAPGGTDDRLGRWASGGLGRIRGRGPALGPRVQLPVEDGVRSEKAEGLRSRGRRYG